MTNKVHILFSKNILARKSLVFFLSLLLVISAVVLIPTLGTKFTWVDDGGDILTARNLINYSLHLNLSGVSGVLIERSIGRFRPIYWVWQSFVVLISGNSPMIQYLLHGISFLGISLLIFQTVRYFSKSNLSAFFAASLFLVIPVNTENLIRLGPQEPIMGFFLILSLYLLFTRKRIKGAIIVLFLAFLCKETAIAIAPAITAYYLLLRLTGRNDPKVFRYMIYSYIFSLFSLLVIFSIRTGYSTYYEFNPAESLYRFGSYISIFKSALPFGVIFLLTYVLRNVYFLFRKGLKKIDQLEILELFFAVLFVTLLAIQSPWLYVIDRYALPATIAVSVFLGIELSNILKFVYKKGFKVYIYTAIFLSAFYSIYLVSNIIRIHGAVVSNEYTTQELQQLMQYIVNKVPGGEKIFINFKENDTTLEPIMELNLQLGLFYNRKDIQVKSVEELSSTDKNYLIISSPTLLGTSTYYSEPELSKNKRLIKSETVQSLGSYSVVSDSETIIKQILKKTFEFAVHHQRFSSDGIYTDFLINDQWNYYYYR